MLELVHGQLLSQTCLVFAERINPTADRRHMLPDVEVEALHQRRIDLPAVGRQHPLARFKGTKHHSVRDAHHAPPARGLDDLGV